MRAKNDNECHSSVHLVACCHARVRKAAVNLSFQLVSLKCSVGCPVDQFSEEDDLNSCNTRLFVTLCNLNWYVQCFLRTSICNLFKLNLTRSVGKPSLKNRYT